jgi:hypothetical protein
MSIQSNPNLKFPISNPIQILKKKKKIFFFFLRFRNGVTSFGGCNNFFSAYIRYLRYLINVIYSDILILRLFSKFIKRKKKKKILVNFSFFVYATYDIKILSLSCFVYYLLLLFCSFIPC